MKGSYLQREGELVCLRDEDLDWLISSSQLYTQIHEGNTDWTQQVAGIYMLIHLYVYITTIKEKEVGNLEGWNEHGRGKKG